MKKDHLFVSDIDDTLLGDDQALMELTNALSAIRSRVVIAYNSSRPCASIRKSLKEHKSLPQPDFIVGALGTEIQDINHGMTVDAYARQWASDWDRDKIAALMNDMGFAAHADEFQTPFKASYHAPGENQYQSVLANLKEKEIRAKVIYSGGKNLDIIPQHANKGTAIEFLRNEFGFTREQVVVAGDSANDRDMFLHAYKGVVVANADDVMKALTGDSIYHARKNCAADVLEGLKHWGVLNP